MCRKCLQAVGIEFEQLGVKVGQDVELRIDPREFVGEEVAGRGAFAVVEGASAAVGGPNLVEPNPGQHDMTSRLEIQSGVRQRQLGNAVSPQYLGDLDEPIHPDSKLMRPLPVLFRRTVYGVADCLYQQVEASSAVDHGLTAEQIQTVDAMGAFVDRVQPVVAVELLNVVITGVAGRRESVWPDRWPPGTTVRASS